LVTPIALNAVDLSLDLLEALVESADEAGYGCRVVLPHAAIMSVSGRLLAQEVTLGARSGERDGIPAAQPEPGDECPEESTDGEVAKEIHGFTFAPRSDTRP